MKDFELAETELQKLHALHRVAKLDKNVNLAYKINAIILLGSGWPLDEVVSALLLDNETLRSYVEKYKQGGVLKLAKIHHKGSSKLRGSASLKGDQNGNV